LYLRVQSIWRATCSKTLRMNAAAHAIYLFFARLGAFGLFGLGVLDSSFLVMPLGKDLLMVALTARQHSLLLYYAAMATAGSVTGCLIMDVIFRKAGEAGLRNHLSAKRIEYIKRKVSANAAWALIVACLAPPPFPFTPFIMATAALQYPRKKMMIVIAASRFLRYLIIGALAVAFGPHILHWAEQPVVEDCIIALVVISIVASTVAVIQWFRRSRRAASAPGSLHPVQLH
jgi:membrane protein YqaA with SNARE-associated domain